MWIPIYSTWKTNSDANQIIRAAQYKYDSARKSFDLQLEKMKKSQESLGIIELEMCSSCIGRFAKVYQFFKTVMIANGITRREMIKIHGTPKLNLEEMQRVSINATEIINGGLASLGTGALVGVASYGAVSMFGAASTGTAIATLSGAAAKSATLAWFGGGALSAGGLGIAGGTIVLGGIVLAPALLIADWIMSSKAEEKLAEAKKKYQEAELAAEKLYVVTDFMARGEKIFNRYIDFYRDFNIIYGNLLNEVENCISKIQSSGTYQFDFNKLSLSEKRLLQITWLMTQVLYQILKTPILTKGGDIQENAEKSIEIAAEVTKNMDLAYRQGKEIDKGTLRILSKLTKKESLCYRCCQTLSLLIVKATKSIFGPLYRFSKINFIFKKISIFTDEFLRSKPRGFLAMVIYALGIFSLFSRKIIPGLFILGAGYIVYPKYYENKDMLRGDRTLLKAALCFTIGIVLFIVM